MKSRLKRAVIVAILAGACGAGIALYQKPDYLLALTLVSSLIGLALGLMFKFRIS